MSLVMSVMKTMQENDAHALLDEDLNVNEYLQGSY